MTGAVVPAVTWASADEAWNLPADESSPEAESAALDDLIVALVVLDDLFDRGVRDEAYARLRPFVEAPRLPSRVDVFAFSALSSEASKRRSPRWKPPSECGTRKRTRSVARRCGGRGGCRAPSGSRPGVFTLVLRRVHSVARAELGVRSVGRGVRALAPQLDQQTTTLQTLTF